MAQLGELRRTQSISHGPSSANSAGSSRNHGPWERSGVGIAFYLLAIGSMAFMDASAKWLVQSYPVGQVAFFRCLFAFLPIGVLVLHGGGLSALSTGRPAMHALRGVTMIAAIFLFFHALKHLMLAEATAIFFVGPLLMVALSVPLLGERVHRNIWVAVIIGFAGVLIMMRPAAEMLRVEACLALGAALFYALTMIATRSLTRTETILSILVYGNLTAVLVSAMSLPFSWVTPTMGDMGVFALMGLCGGLSTFYFAKACRYSRVSVLAPFEYTALVWAAGIGFIVWHEVPDLWVWLGTTVVVVMGLYVWRDQTRRERSTLAIDSKEPVGLARGEILAPATRAIDTKGARRKSMGKQFPIQ